MTTELIIAIAISAAAGVTLLTAALPFWLRCRRLARELAEAQTYSSQLMGKIEEAHSETRSVRSSYIATMEKSADHERDLAAAKARLEHLEEKLADQRVEFVRQREESKAQFENLAIRIMDQSAEKLELSSRKSIDTLLSPLQNRLRDFEQKVSDTYDKEARERFALKSELEKMILANHRISEDANNLTRALKGDVKQQGNWGELKLEIILQSSGLREGDEYIREAKMMQLKSADGKSLRPDVIIHLPDAKHVVVDAKVSLVAYERWISNSDEAVKATALKDFLKSIKSHVDGLSGKNYEMIEGLSSPDFVLMFCPIESAFSLLMESDGDLLTYAWERRVMIVTPTTLLTGLRTIASLWKSERQNKNAMEIARQGGALYDKFAAFVSDLDKVGKNIVDTQKSYESAFNKLTSGRGNLLNRVEKLRELGAKTTKKLELTD